jgi:ATP-dependent RNA helicase DDX3X
MDNITRCKYTKPTPVQRYALPIAIGGRDLMACAQVRVYVGCSQSRFS